MPNIATLLKSEITRLARKELRGEADTLRKALSAHRSEIAALKRQLADLQRAVKGLTKQAASRPARAPAEVDEDHAHRFRAGGMAANRKRLGLSAADFGLLVGTTGQSVYAWEQGRSKPRKGNLAAIAALRGIGKKEVADQLAKLKAAK